MTGTPESAAYDTAFYNQQFGESSTSAKIVVGKVAEVVVPNSVLDVGCGTGTWLAQWSARGLTDLVGVDGDYVDRAQLNISADMFRPADLTVPLDLGRRFDLVQCLEVAEHLDEPDADTLVESLSRHSDLVLFSAAIPGQGGTHHVNERWPSYWAPKFTARGFELFDVLRPLLWADDRIAFYYRQNVLLYARGDVAEQLRGRGLAAMPALDLIHPELYDRNRRRPPLSRQVARAAVDQAKGLVRRFR